MANENKLEDMIRTSLESIRSMIDANTIIGDPIKTESGVTIIPISKIMVGYASGGVDFQSKRETADKSKNFGGGGGTGLTVSPVAFLTVDRDGRVDLLNIGTPAPVDLVGQAAEAVDRAPEMIAKIKALFGKKKKAKEAEADDLISRRKTLYNERNDENCDEVKEKAKEINTDLNELRKEIRMCKAIFKDSYKIAEKKRQAMALQEQADKELMKDEHKRRSR